MNIQPLVFTLNLKEFPVTIDDQEYVLLELDGKERDKYLNNLGGRLRMSPNGKSQSVKNFEGLQASLIHASLRKINMDGREMVSVKTIQEWPATVVSGLYNAARKLSALDEEEDDEEGND